MVKWARDTAIRMKPIIAGSDCIIVGSGIHRADNPAKVAKQYAKLSWQGLLDR